MPRFLTHRNHEIINMCYFRLKKKVSLAKDSAPFHQELVSLDFSRDQVLPEMVLLFGAGFNAS